jgi:thiamine biosynthesis lipoprotein
MMSLLTVRAVERLEGRWLGQPMKLEWELPAGSDPILDTVKAELLRLEIMLGAGTNHTVGAINQNSGGDWVQINNEMALLFARCREMWRRTNGLFDPSFGAATQIWNFEKRDYFNVPNPKALMRAVDLTNFGRISLRANPPALQLPKDMVIDLSDIGLGYSLDRLIEMLVTAGVPKANLSMGALTRAWGPEGQESLVAVPHPFKAAIVLANVPSRNQTVASRSIRQNAFVVNGRSYHGLLDPRTGWPTSGSSCAVVVATRSEFAQALSGALMCEDPENGMLLLKKFPGVEALLVGLDGRVLVTKGMLPYLASRSPP